MRSLARFLGRPIELHRIFVGNFHSLITEKMGMLFVRGKKRILRGLSKITVPKSIGVRAFLVECTAQTGLSDPKKGLALRDGPVDWRG